MVDLDAVTIPDDILKLIPKKMALEFSILPVGVESDSVVIAASEHYNKEILNDLPFLLGKRVRVQTMEEDNLLSAIEKYYGVSTALNERNVAARAKADFLLVEEEEQKIDSSTCDGQVISLANRIISDAITMKASDIHIEPYEKSLRVRYRLDGVLHEILRPPLEKSKPLISRFKIMADLDIAEKRRPQDGRIRVKEDGKTIDIRVSTLPTDFGEKVVLRILDKTQLQLDLTKLGFAGEDLNLFQRTAKLPYGMILVTGPTGSGKTTTLYAALNYINHPEINITTIEDPIEYNLAGINQTHVRSDIGLTFAASLRSILRQDPNVIMVGEIRDSETAEIAIRAALTGHLVFSTLHTNDAPSAIARLVDMGIEPFLVASSVKMILAQRLLRKLCQNCKYEVEPTEDQILELSLKKDSQRFYKGKGCPSCNSLGYRGRTAVYEVLPIQNGLSDEIAKGVSASQIRQKAKLNGMLSLREAAIVRAVAGETSLEEVIRETAI